MKNIRWYDRNPDLKEVFDFIQGLGEAYQAKIAQDIIQILVGDFHLNLDEIINNINAKSNDYDFQRWYDKNIDMFTSFEIIKILPENLQAEVIKRIIETVLFIYLEDGASPK